MSEQPIDEPRVIIEYQVRPGSGVWITYGQMVRDIAMWAVIPSAGPPAVTISKRVTVKGPGQGGVNPEEPGSMIAALFPGAFERVTEAMRKADQQTVPAPTDQPDTVVACTYCPEDAACTYCGGDDADQPDTETEAQHPECAAAVSGSCLAETQSDSPCDTEAGECVHGGRPVADQPDTETEAQPFYRGGRCPVMFEGGGRCEKNADHRDGRWPDDPHTPEGHGRPNG